MEDLNHLADQLSQHHELITVHSLVEILKTGAIVIARDTSPPQAGQRQGRIVGMATLIVVTKMSSRLGLIEDVVVDEQFRGKGIARELMERLIALAKVGHLSYLDLTSHSSRVAAHALYKKLGFELRDTSKFRLKL